MTQQAEVPTRTGPIAQHHDEEAWLQERRKHMTASNIAAIFGDHPYQTAADVQAEKLGLTDGQKETQAMRRGKVLEPIAAREYELLTGRRVRRIPMLVHRTRPLFAASLDRQILAGTDNPTAALEIKVPGWRMFSQMKRQGLPRYMIYQGQLEAEVAGYDFCAFGVFNADAWSLLPFDLERDAGFCADIMDRAEEWWGRHIINREPVEEATPPEKLPELEGEVTSRDDPAFVEAATALLDARDLKKETEEFYDQAKDQLKAVLAAHGVFEGAGARIYYRQMPGRENKDWKGLEKARPVDPALLQAFLLQRLPNLGAIEEQDVLELLQTIGDECVLDLSAFVKRGASFEELRPYRLTLPAEL